MIHNIDIDTNSKKYLYKINNQTYIVPNIGFQIKLWDFDFACIPGIVDNIKVSSKWTKKINITPEQNRYYDIHYFFNTLIRKGFFPQILTDPNVPSELKQFIDRVLPYKYRADPTFIHEKGRILINDEYLTPEQILKSDPYFEEFRINKSTKSQPINKLFTKPQTITNESVDINTNTYKLIKDDKNKSKKPKSNSNIDILKLLGESTQNKESSNKNNLDILDLLNNKIKKK